jgi:hypothetical protein
MQNDYAIEHVLKDAGLEAYGQSVPSLPFQMLRLYSAVKHREVMGTALLRDFRPQSRMGRMWKEMRECA